MTSLMSPFEYVTVLISIVLGMGITQIVSGFANIVIRWEKVKTYWPHTVLCILVFILHIQDWWATYELLKFNQWRLPTFLFFILYPVNLYILTRILFPQRWSTSANDLKAFYFLNFRKIYLFMIFLPVHSIIDNHFIGEYGLSEQIPQFLVLTTLIIVAIGKKKNEWIHKMMAVFFLIIMIMTFVLAWNRLLIAA